jgi:hypothetical protein
LDLNKIIGVSEVVAKQNYPAGVGISDGGANEATNAIDKGALLGLKFHMNAPTSFVKENGARTS